jgi:hypothetical protein
MAFVNQTQALNQLQNIHISNLKRALDGAGLDWIVPICDNIFGLGKTEFANQYVKQSNKTMSQKQCSSEKSELELTFKNSIHHAHTVKVTFTPGEMHDEDTFEKVLVTKLQETMIPLFNVSPSCLLESFQNSGELLSELIFDAGPLFIVLDDIGAAFCVPGLKDLERRELFFKFCSKVLSKWLLIPNLYFLLVGRGSFLNYVGSRPGLVEEWSASSLTFKRLSLHFLRPHSIVEILKNTHRGEKTLYSYYNLSDEKAEKVASYLFLQTTGHPRSLLKAFRTCSTFDQLMEYTVTGNVIPNYDDFYRHLSIFEEEIQDILSKVAANLPADLSAVVVYRGKVTPLGNIVNNALMAWDGAFTAARLSVSPDTIQLIATYFSSLKDYLTLIIRSLKLSLDFADIFEVMLMKRFQELFQEARRPSEALPDFFDTQVLGCFKDLRLAETARPMLNIISRGSGSRLQDATVNNNLWPVLLKEMDQYDSLCLKPRLRSGSSDVLFFGNVKRYRKIRRFSIGIAGKNFNETTMANLNDINKECAKFNVMFEGSETVHRLNILIFCATNYGPGLQTEFGNRHFFTLNYISAWPNIDEVVVLDLSSREKRSQFFGFSTEDPLCEAIEGVISKHCSL